LYDLLNNYPILKNALDNKLIFNAGISILDPHISIPQHIGYFKGFLRYQICIETNDNDPNKPYIVCGEQKYTWKTGEGVLFDDMFNHYVVNNSDSRRIVLYLDIIRQNLPKIIIKINNLICDLCTKDKLYNYILKKQHVQRKNK
jgi:aspartyl/asparaginyl beta-hydroxylase (cupin superfamily)